MLFCSVRLNPLLIFLYHHWPQNAIFAIMQHAKIDNQASYEAYLNVLFSVAVTTHGTPTESIEDVLLAKAQSYGRTGDVAMLDIKQILNVRSAVSILLKKASEEKFNSIN